MSNRIIKIRFQNGLTFDNFIKEVFETENLTSVYRFEESDEPDFVVFGPYGNDIPPKGKYTRIGYFCENVKPDLSICDWAFGIPYEDNINDPRYKRIQWHGTNPKALVKTDDYDAKQILERKKHFCNFFYSNTVPYREEFFRQLSRYKTIDAPGKSMNNMQNIDVLFKGDKWERKRQFLSEYKFTIAFENYVYPGYQTEKLYDAMQVNSLPIYCGDPRIGNIFNTGSFINVSDYIRTSDSTTVNLLEKYSQPDFKDIRPSFYNKPLHRIKRKLKTGGRQLKMHYQFQKLDFKPVIDLIVELDQDDDKYIKMLQQPWFVNNKLPLNVSLKDHWIKIFSKAI